MSGSYVSVDGKKENTQVMVKKNAPLKDNVLVFYCDSLIASDWCNRKHSLQYHTSYCLLQESMFS